MARQVHVNPFGHLEEWLYKRLQGDTFMAAMFRNVANWCQGLAEGWRKQTCIAVLHGRFIPRTVD